MAGSVQGGYKAWLRGTRNHTAVLTVAAVRQIRAVLEVDGSYASVCALAATYGVKPPTIYKIRNRERWAHVD